MIDPLDNQPTLSELPNKEKGEYYELISDEESLNLFGTGKSEFFDVGEVVIGYIQPNGDIEYAGEIMPQIDLENSNIDISLSRFYVQGYPGGKKHIIQVNFSAEHCLKTGNKQDVSYGYLLEVNDNEGASITGANIFRGLKVTNGFQIEIGTILIADKLKEKIYKYLKSDELKIGIDLLAVVTLNPLVGLITNLFSGVTSLILANERNKSILRVVLGLSLGNQISSPKLREGGYVVIQAKYDKVNLSHYQWKEDRITDRRYGNELGRNYIVFQVQKTDRVI